MKFPMEDDDSSIRNGKGKDKEPVGNLAKAIKRVAGKLKRAKAMQAALEKNTTTLIQMVYSLLNTRIQRANYDEGCTRHDDRRSVQGQGARSQYSALDHSDGTYLCQ